MHTFPTINYLCSRLGHRRARDVSCIDAPFWYLLWPHCPSPWCNQPNNQRITIRGDLARVCHPNVAENPVLASQCSPSEDTWEKFVSSLRAGNGWASPQLRFPLKGCGSGDAHILHYPQTRWCKTIIYDAQGVWGPGNPPGCLASSPHQVSGLSGVLESSMSLSLWCWLWLWAWLVLSAGTFVCGFSLWLGILHTWWLGP